MTVSTKRKGEAPGWRAWLVLILLAAACLRLYALTDVPPGLTHDEADHGLTAWSIVGGVRAVYFTVGYGREPLYDYATAALMTFLGPTYLAARLAAVYFGLLLVAGMAAWTRLAFDQRTALLTAAGLAVSFWAVMTSRQALRSVTLPALFVLAVYCFWRGLQAVARAEQPAANQTRTLIPFIWAGLFLGSAFYTYIPARLMWLVLPALWLYLALVQRRLFRRAWRGVALALLVAAAIGAPLFIYLYTNPAAEVRIGQLSQPLAQAAGGNLGPLLENAGGSLRLFTVAGDTAWRYNVAGRPLLSPVMGALFYAGLVVASWQAIRPIIAGRVERWQSVRPTLSPAAGCALALAWLVAGLAPALVTGPELSMTQAIGMQPVLYLFPALALGWVEGGKWKVEGGKWKVVGWLAVVVLFAGTAVVTVRDYFGRWANEPGVRVQYESTMVAAMRYLNEREVDAAAVSTITPGRFHSPAVAQMTLRRPVDVRWFDGRSTLLLPQTGETLLIFSGFAPLAAGLAGYFETARLVETLPLRPDDLDRPLTVYGVDGEILLPELRRRFTRVTGAAAANFGDTLEFLGYELQTPQVAPGETVRVATLWRVRRPPQVEMVLFTQALGPDGVVAQADVLGVPAEWWRPGDVFIQLHQFQIPLGTTAGEYPLITGLYVTATEQRLPVLVDGRPTNDHLPLTSLQVTR